MKSATVDESEKPLRLTQRLLFDMDAGGYFSVRFYDQKNQHGKRYVILVCLGSTAT